MADITRYPFVRHVRGTETTHVQYVRNGTTVRQGTGASFWFRPLSAVLSEVPVDDRELPLLFHARTADFQDVTVQATVTFRFTDPARAAARVDFSIDPEAGRWRATPLEQVTTLLAETAQQYAIDLLAGVSLQQALTTGLRPVRETITAGLTGDQRLAETGIAVVGARVVAIRPEPEVEKALRTPTREQLQQDADRASYERRAVAVERERAISQNELQSKIELARREEELVDQRGVNARREAEQAAVAGQVQAQARAEQDRVLAQAEADRTRTIGDASAAAEAAKLTAYRDLPPGVLWALAAREVAEHLPHIENLVLTPDLLAPVLAKLGAGK